MQMALQNRKGYYAFLVLMLRIFLASVFYGQIVYLVYSMAGGILCFLADVVINRLLKGKYIYITAVFGALFHNAGQMLAAFFFLGKGLLLREWGSDKVKITRWK